MGQLMITIDFCYTPFYCIKTYTYMYVYMYVAATLEDWLLDKEN